MKATEIREFNDEQWKAYADLLNSISKKFHPEENVEETKWTALKNEMMEDIQTYNFKMYMIEDDGKAVGWSSYIVMGSSIIDFSFDADPENIPDGFMKIVIELALKFMTENNKKEIYIDCKDERLIRAIKKAGPLILDEKVYSQLKRDEIDPEYLEEIINEAESRINYELRLYTDITEEIIDEYLRISNETKEDKEFYNPQKKEITKLTKEKLAEFMKYTKGPKDLMYMYILFDENKIAAFCSLFVRENSKHIINHGGGLTTVGKNYRGKNLAKYLKAKMYLLMLEKHQDFEFIKTDTYPWNKFMYRINEEMGFKPYEKYTEMKLTKEAMENFLNSL